MVLWMMGWEATSSTKIPLKRTLKERLTESDETLGKKHVLFMVVSWLMFFPPKSKIEEENHGFQKGFPFPKDLFSGFMLNFVGVCMLHVL